MWRNFWILMQDKQITSLQYMEFVQKQLIHETAEQTIASGLMNLSALINNYLPISVCAEKERALFDIMMTLL